MEPTIHAGTMLSTTTSPEVDRAIGLWVLICVAGVPGAYSSKTPLHLRPADRNLAENLKYFQGKQHQLQARRGSQNIM
jgi:hypothetical protein